MPHTYWENLQPFGADHEEPAEPVAFDQLRKLCMSLQSTMLAARQLAERVAAEARQPASDADSTAFAR